MSEKSFDVVVAGLGAMGSAAAFHLARQGLRVLGLDAREPPHAEGSSHGRTRIIREAYFEDPVYVPLVRRAHRLWRKLEAETGQPLLRTTGALTVGASNSELIEGTLRSAQQYDLPHERLEADEIRRRFSALRPTSGTGGVWEPSAGILAPEHCVRAHLGAARERGATFRLGTPMLAWRPDGEAVEVTAERERVRAGALVLALGPWLPNQEPWLPLEVERQTTFWFRPAEELGVFGPEQLPVFLWDRGHERLFYGVPDLGEGVKVARHHGGDRGPLPSLRRGPDAADLSPVREFLDEHIPGASGPVLRSEVCFYTDTPDGHFLLDRHPRCEAVWIVSACSGHGFKFASVVGERIAEWVWTGTPPADLAPFRLSRFPG